MYKISTRGQYALLIMEDLAELESDAFVPLRVISHRRNLSVKYLEQILARLVKKKLVTGNRGLNGGYRLTRDASSYTVGEILRSMEGDLSPRSQNEGNTVESEGSRCFWDAFEKTVNEFVDSVSLDKLVRTNKEYVGFEYCI